MRKCKIQRLKFKKHILNVNLKYFSHVFFLVTVEIAFNRRRNVLAQIKSSNTELALSQCVHDLGRQGLLIQELSHSHSSVPTASLSGKISLR